MLPETLTQSDVFAYLILPLAIFLARIADVSLGTLRIMLVGRGMRFLAPVLGFFEVLIWLLAIGQIMQNLDNWATYIAYAAGFAAGNYVGILLERKLAVGICLVRFIIPGSAARLKRFLDKAGFRVTSVTGHGVQGDVEIVFTIVRRRMLRRLSKLVQRYNPRAFYTVEDVRYARESGDLPLARGPYRRRTLTRKWK
jgi:uncharacterized protein YebE (UPF0316 family)